MRHVARSRRVRVLAVAGVAVLGAAAASCRQDMHDQPKYRPFRPSEFFSDHRSARPFVPGTVARGLLREDALLYTGKQPDGSLAETLPMPVDLPLLQRGRVQYESYCAPCHGLTGTGNGMIVQRGFKKPPSFHIDRLRLMPVGYVFDVATNGFGAMSDYAAQVTVQDRWAIAAYVRTLQLSQYAPVDAVAGAGERAEAAAQAPAAGEAHGAAPEGH